MIRYLYATELANHPVLADSMFRDRAAQFHDRMGWDVTVDENGHERDQYDVLNPLYVIWEQPDGTHGGSMRFLPTTGRTMVNEHFLNLTDGVRIESPLIWECTRFCLAPDASPRVSAALMLAGGEILRGFYLDHFVGVFDARMIRVYKMLGGSPDILGMSGDGPDAIGVGLWEFTGSAHAKLMRRAGITAEQSEAWFHAAFREPGGTTLKAA
ncbi:N-acyl-L-homoserine lactone synthetase [Palleronia marisminoris]|uniref:Acyl-homoserine-lactone synthase n=1 Tax=Palleronia marisminoris TaxID=315423 RepID=A0A1Y5RUY0_9RHOB|nr:acyl-homoserine-lactone synthase [Palleronia marisminoris]SFG46683.1 N-acyl-L-homoserine lactone synthetase [Palleronia marisminoris]SLN25648.1 Acyl-homoserine-lactone synthase [Palleronia marisminoris]